MTTTTAAAAATILPTRNEGYGFWGTIHIHSFRADRAWEVASTMIAAATGCSPEGVRDFLDARDGRHFADDVLNHLQTGAPVEVATERAVSRWMGWKIDRRATREHGIPTGLPYLTGWVAHYEIQAELAD